MNDFNLDLHKYLKELEFLVNIDSGSRFPEGTEKIAAFFEKKYRQMDWKVTKHNFDGDVGPCLEIRNHNNGETDILLIGHMDTVFKEGTAEKRPFTIKGDRAYGPGVIDMKSGLLSMYYALKSIQEEGNGNNLSITVILNSDEEIGSRYSSRIIERVAKKSKVALIIEPARANGALVLQRKGLAAYDIEFHGKAAHAGIEPEKGASAIVELANWVLELNKLNDFQEGTTVNVGIISGGTGRNVVADRARAQVDLRFRKMEEMIRVEDTIKRLSYQPVVKGVNTVVNKLGMRPPMNPTAVTEKIWDIIKDISRQMGMNLEWVATGGGSDANYTAALGVPSIDGLGPVGGGAHGENEYLEINSIEPRYQLLKGLIIDKRLHELLQINS